MAEIVMSDDIKWNYWQHLSGALHMTNERHYLKPLVQKTLYQQLHHRLVLIESSQCAVSSWLEKN